MGKRTFLQFCVTASCFVNTSFFMCRGQLCVLLGNQTVSVHTIFLVQRMFRLFKELFSVLFKELVRFVQRALSACSNHMVSAIFVVQDFCVGEEGSSEALGVAKAGWQAAASSWWSSHADQPGQQVKPRKKHRAKAYDWTAASDHVLRAVTGYGRECFCEPGGGEVQQCSPELWPNVTLAIDQGSDGWAAAHA